MNRPAPRLPVLTDGEIRLRLESLRPGAAAVGRLPSYFFTIIALADGKAAGRCDLRVGWHDNIRYAGHIGYNVLPAYRGRHYAAKACRLLYRLARLEGMSQLLITCDPENLPSRRTCELAGGQYLGTVIVPADTANYQAGDREKCQYLVNLAEDSHNKTQ